MSRWLADGFVYSLETNEDGNGVVVIDGTQVVADEPVFAFTFNSMNDLSDLLALLKDYNVILRRSDEQVRFVKANDLPPRDGMRLFSRLTRKVKIIDEDQ